MAARILVADGDPVSARTLGDELHGIGCEVDVVDRSDHVLDAVRRRRPGILFLSLSLPGHPDALTLCRQLEQSALRVSVVATAVREVAADHVRALRAGADHFMALPSTRDELEARVGALLRRSQPGIDAVRLGATLIDFRQQMAIAGDHSLPLTGREFEVLRCLAARQGAVVSREELLESVWGCAPARSPRTIDNCMVRLRQKLEDDPHHPTFIRKAYGDGYRLVASEWLRYAGTAVARSALTILELLLLIAAPVQLTVV